MVSPELRGIPESGIPKKDADVPGPFGLNEGERPALADFETAKQRFDHQVVLPTKAVRQSRNLSKSVFSSSGLGGATGASFGWECS